MTTETQPLFLPFAAMPKTGGIITAVVILFLVFDGVAKVLEVPAVVKASAQLGLPPNVTGAIGILLLACTAIYASPRTAVLGAVLLTGYLGGATAIHVRAGNGAFPVAFSIATGALAWLGLILREPRLLLTILLRQ